MRLISAHVRGIGRLADEKINLDKKLIAIVGPNEAGKTTLLSALQRIDSGQEVPLWLRTRVSEIDDSDIAVSVTFQLDEEDRIALEPFNLKVVPAKIVVSRRADGDGPYIVMNPMPARDFSPLGSQVNALLEAVHLMIREYDGYTAEEMLDKYEVEDLLSRTEAIIERLNETVSQQREAEDELVEDLQALINEWSGLRAEAEVGTLLRAILAWFSDRLNVADVRNALWRRSPDFLLFDEESRNLASAYTLTSNVANRPPRGLKNLADLASLDLVKLLEAYNREQSSVRSTMINRANNRLKSEFELAWNQSRLAVRFEMEGDVLNIRIVDNDETVTVFDERSAGLRMFVALWAFIKARNLSVKPILLIDEAELHLHLDAQADLIQMFTTQDQVANVIYTTHSPGCLPPDLGTGVRVIAPSTENPNLSHIHNGFWTSSVGFSPLMMAMGAGASAFSTVRYVVLAEGASEMLLLPTLLREANGESSLQYQIAPGLSEVPKRLFPELDLEAARVVYLVDGDEGGRSLRKTLQEAGIPQHLIIDLGTVTLENLLNPDSYKIVVEELLQESNMGVAIPVLPNFRNHSEPWPTVLRNWAEPLGLRVPSKIAVASRLVERGKAIPSDGTVTLLRTLHEEISAALKIR